jgi:DNA mismatch repair protein MutS2
MESTNSLTDIYSHSTPNLLTTLDWPEVQKRIRAKLYLSASQDSIDQTFHWNPKSEVERLYHVQRFLIKLESKGQETIKLALARVQMAQSFFSIPPTASRGIILSEEEVDQVYKVILAYLELRSTTRSLSSIQRPEDDFPIIRLEKLLSPLIGSDGNLSILLHPELRQISTELHLLDSNLRLQAKSLLPKNANTDHAYSYDVINDRFCLCVRSDQYSHSQGKIMARSESGSMLFLEHSSLAKGNDQRSELIAKIELKKFQILKDFSEKISFASREILIIARFLVELDLALAKNIFSCSYDGVIPEVVENEVWEISHLIHPLIKNAQSNSLHLDEKKRVLLISGPNAGGKSTLLKALGLGHIFVNLGIPVAASSWSAPHPRHLYFISQDLQSLEDGISSFISEFLAFREVANAQSNNSLLLADEVFRSTASDEASGLAYSLLSNLSKRAGVRTIATTHHTLLKVLAHEDERFLSAHMEYSEEFRPTYRLIIGAPGPSLALESLERFQNETIAGDIITYAREVLDSRGGRQDFLLSELAYQRARSDKLEKLFRDRVQAEELERKRLALELEESFERKLDSAILDFTKRYSAPPKGAIERVRALPKEVIAPLVKKVEPARDHFEPIEGKRCFCITLNREVIIISLESRNSRAKVQAGNKHVWVKISDLVKAKGQTQKSSDRVKINVSFADEDTSITLDGRGLRREYFIQQVEGAIARILAGVQRHAIIIHGHGDGILKAALVETLSRYSGIQCDTDHHGGSVTLKAAR